jgi:hypothetical protein
MWPYWLLFLIPAIAALNERRPSPPPGTRTRKRFSDGPGWWLVATLLALMIGLRHKVGSRCHSYSEA